MALVAARFPDEHDRSRMMGLVLGAVASGVLVGYPSGGFLYDFAGKAAPFTLVAVFACINTGMRGLLFKSTKQIVIYNILWG